MTDFRKIFALALALSLASAGVQAQTFDTFNEHNAPENDNINPDNTVNRGSYLTNAWDDNWSIGLAVGAQTLVSEGNGKIAVTPDFELNVTKWVTPSIGFRIGFQGVNVAENRDFHKQVNHYEPKWENGQYKFTQMYINGNFLVNLTNIIGGYKETRLVNVIPYFHAGFYRLGHPDYPYLIPKRSDGEMMRDREVAFGPGVLLNFRATDRLSVTFDLRDAFLGARYHDFLQGGLSQNISAAVGLQYTFKKWYFTRFRTAEAPLRNSLTDAYTALADAKNALAKVEERNAQLQVQLTNYAKEKEDLKKTIVFKDELTTRLMDAGTFLLFDINSPDLNYREQVYLEKYVSQSLAVDSNHVFYITGSADKGTGNIKFNTRLSAQRAENVKKILMEKFHVPESQIVIKATIISDEHEDARLDRCILLENK